MSKIDDLHTLTRLLKEFELPVSPILEYAINEKIEELSSDDESPAAMPIVEVQKNDGTTIEKAKAETCEAALPPEKYESETSSIRIERQVKAWESVAIIKSNVERRLLQPIQAESVDSVIDIIFKFKANDYSNALTLLAIISWQKKMPTSTITDLSFIKEEMQRLFASTLNVRTLKGQCSKAVCRLYFSGFLCFDFFDGQSFPKELLTLYDKDFATKVKNIKLAPSLKQILDDDVTYQTLYNAIIQLCLEPMLTDYNAVTSCAHVDALREVKYYKKLFNRIYPSGAVSVREKAIALLAIVWEVEMKGISHPSFVLTHSLNERYMALLNRFKMNDKQWSSLTVVFSELAKEPFFHKELTDENDNGNKYGIDSALFGHLLSKKALYIKRMLNGLAWGMSASNWKEIVNWPELITSYEKPVIPANAFTRYAKALGDLHCTKAKGKRDPNKAILLITVFEMFDKRAIPNQFDPDYKLLEAFEKTWIKYVGNIVYDSKDSFSPKFFSTFYALGETSFWYLHGDYGKIHGNPTFKAFERFNVTASLDEELYFLLNEKDTRERLKAIVIENNL